MHNRHRDLERPTIETVNSRYKLMGPISFQVGKRSRIQQVIWNSIVRMVINLRIQEIVIIGTAH